MRILRDFDILCTAPQQPGSLKIYQNHHPDRLLSKIAAVFLELEGVYQEWG